MSSNCLLPMLLLLLLMVPGKLSQWVAAACCMRVVLRFPDSSSPFLPIRQDDDDDDECGEGPNIRILAREVSYPLLMPCSVIGLTSYLAACFYSLLGITANWWLGVDVDFAVGCFCCSCCVLQISLCGQYAILVQLILYQYGCENWFGGRSNAKRSTADWLGPKLESCDKSPSTWDWYSAM